MATFPDLDFDGVNAILRGQHPTCRCRRSRRVSDRASLLHSGDTRVFGLLGHGGHDMGSPGSGAPVSASHIPRLESEKEIERQEPYVRRVLRGFGLRGFDLDDACQEVLLVAHRRWPSFRGRSSTQTWLYGICRFVVYGHQRRARRWRERIPVDGWEPRVDDGFAPMGTPFSDLDHRQRGHALQRALDFLKDSQSEPLLMYEVGQLSAEDIAGFLRVAPRTIRARVYAARREMKRRLGRARFVAAAPDPTSTWLPPPPLADFPSDALATTAPVHVSYCDASHCVGSVGHVVLTCSRGRPTVQRARSIGSHVAAIASLAPGKVVVLQCADSAPELPDRDWRREFRDLARHFSSDIAAYGLVMSEQPIRRMAFGFIASTVLLFRPSLSAAAFSNMDDALNWLARRNVLHDVHPTRISAALGSMRARLDAVGTEHPSRA